MGCKTSINVIRSCVAAGACRCSDGANGGVPLAVLARCCCRRAPPAPVSPNKADRCGRMPSMNSPTAAAHDRLSRDLLCIKMCVFVCFPSVVGTPATPRLLPSASFRRHNCNRLIITVNHCRRPVVFFFPRRQPPLCPCPPPPTPLSQISYSQARRRR